MLTSTSALLSRMRWAWRAGMQFNGARDLYSVFGYNRTPQHKDFVERYVRQDVAKRIINAPADATWADPPALRIGEDGPEWEEWKALVEEFNPFPHLRKGDIFAGLGSFAICVVGIDDGQALDQPVRPSSRKRRILYMQPYLEGSVTVLEYESDSRSTRFGQPTMYEVNPGDELNMRSTSTATLRARKKFKVHHSRVLHLADNTLENTVFGHSRLESIYNNLDDLMKITGGSAETYWLASNRGMQIDVDKDMELGEEDAENLTAEIEEYQHQLRRTMRTRGVTIKNLGADVADPRPAFSVQMSLLSANTGIPQRVLMGAEAGQLASQQDRANWAITVANRVALFAEPVVLRPFLELLENAGVIKIPSNLYIAWPEPFKMNPLERAQTSAQMARSAVNVARALAIQQENKTDLLSIEEARSVIAPGDKMPVFYGAPKGTLPPPIEEVLQAETEAALAATLSDTGSGENAPDPDDKRPEEER